MASQEFAERFAELQEDAQAAVYRYPDLTEGEWTTEEASALEFDLRVEHHGLFAIHHEVRGTLLQPRLGQVDRSVRIDRVLFPTKRLADAGWSHGAIGVEIKRSGVKVGPVLAQAIDYTRSAFTLPAARGVTVLLSAVFIWPLGKQYGPVASVMAQNRVGSVGTSNWVSLHFQIGQETLLRISPDGGFAIGDTRSGRKVGSR